MVSMALDWNDWDLTLDENGNIMAYTDDNAIAQSCANDVRLFTREAFFNQLDGIPHFDLEFDNSIYAIAIVVQNRIEQACKNVDGVTDCVVTLTYDKDSRVLGGTIGIETDTGSTINLEI